MEKLLRKEMERLYARIAAEVPGKGYFEPIEQEFDNPDKRLIAKKFGFKVEQPPEGIENYELTRCLYFQAQGGDRYTSVHILLVVGDKQHLLDALKTEDLHHTFMNHTRNLSYHLLGF